MTDSELSEYNVVWTNMESEWGVRPVKFGVAQVDPQSTGPTAVTGLTCGQRRERERLGSQPRNRYIVARARPKSRDVYLELEEIVRRGNREVPTSRLRWSS